MAALIIAAALVAYANALPWLVERRGWDQWGAFTIGNAALTAALFFYALVSGLLPAVWGRVGADGLALGAAAGLVPLAVILTLMFLPGSLGRDIVASGIGKIPPRRFLYRVGVQVALTTVVCEEFAFRGVLQVLLARVVGAPYVVGLDAAAFGLWHTTLQYNGFAHQSRLARVGATVGGTILYALLGFVQALVRQRTDSLLAAIVAHGVLDVLMFVGMYVRRGRLTAA